MSELATKSAIMGMVGQILPGLVREKMFDFKVASSKSSARSYAAPHADLPFWHEK